MKKLWRDKETKGKDRLDLLVYRSRLIGLESKLCVWGGGNTSTKWIEPDFRGRPRRVVRVKGSGSDLKCCERKDFSPLLLEEILPLLQRRAMTDEEMVEYLRRSLLDPTAPRPSIEALLHAFVPENDIDHTHADGILSLTNTAHAGSIVHRLFGKELLWIPYIKPGFELAKRVERAYRADPTSKGAVLEKHGLITWGRDAKTSYERTVEMVSRAEEFIRSRSKKRRVARHMSWGSLSKKERDSFYERHLPQLRKILSTHRRVILCWRDTPAVLNYLNTSFAREASQQGPATPDHMLRTKRLPLFMDVDPRKGPLALTPEEMKKQINRYAENHKRYYLKYRRPNQPMLDPFPRVLLVPGVGMITTGKDLKEAQIVSEIYEHSLAVQTNASTIDRYVSLPPAKAFAIEYWPLELYKLSAPPEAELSRQVGLLTGAAGGIGQAIARKCVREGAHLVLTDLDEKKVASLSQKLNKEMNSPRTIGISMDVTDEISVRTAFKEALRAFGGVDFLISNAGVAHVGSIDRLSLSAWNESIAVNATGHFLVAREVVRHLKAQELGGSIVFMASKNVLAPGKEFGAYSAAKSAEAQLARILAMENGEAGIRVNMINPDGVFENSLLWARIRKNRAETYGISADKLESYYQKRNLMKVRVSPEDVAEAAFFFISKRSSKTTGCILTVDGGLREAFPR